MRLFQYRSTRRSRQLVLFCFLATFVSLEVRADVFVDDFEDDVNIGGWSHALLPIPLTPTGGNPGGMLRTHICCDTFVPMAITLNEDTPFHGDYAARGVMTIQADLYVFEIELTSGFVEFPLSLRIFTDAGTPDDPNDDYAVRFQGGDAHATPPPPPLPGFGWKTITFDIPAQAKELPPGWNFVHHDTYFYSPPIPRDASWEIAMANVTGVALDYGPHDPFWPLLEWDFGLDNVTIVDDANPIIDGDLDHDGDVDFADLLALLAAWGACKKPCAEDLDASGDVGFADLLVLLANWT